MGAIGAATALDLLKRDPDSLLASPSGGAFPMGRRDKSAAKLARERYMQALETKAPADLLDFDSPAAASSAMVEPLSVSIDAQCRGVADGRPATLVDGAAPNGSRSSVPGPGATLVDLLDLQAEPAEPRAGITATAGVHDLLSDSPGVPLAPAPILGLAATAAASSSALAEGGPLPLPRLGIAPPAVLVTPGGAASIAPGSNYAAAPP